jgi:O-antigen/teichoic acid export membrane protein
LFGERYSKVFRGAAAQAASRMIMMVLPLVTIPLTINYLGHERFGMWMAITSLSALLAVTEGGISNALITPVAQANAQGDIAAIRRLVATALAMVTLLAAAICAAVLVSAELVDWRSLLNLKSDLAAAEAAQVFRILGCAAALSFVVGVGLKARRGLNQIAAVASWETAGALLAIPALLAVTMLKLGTPWLAAALLFTPLAVNLVGLAIFVARNPQFTPAAREFDRGLVNGIARSSAMFLTASLASAALVGLDPMLIAKIGSAEDVSAFVVAQRLFTLPFVLANFWFYAQWPVLAEALQRRETRWVSASFSTTLWLSVGASTAMAAILVYNFDLITRLWIGRPLEPGALLLWSMAAYSVLMVISGACSTLMYALEARRQQTLIMAATAVCALPLKIMLLHLFLPAGAVMATVIIYALVQAAPFCVIIPRRLRARPALAAA